MPEQTAADDAVVASIRVLQGPAVREFLFRRGAPSRLWVGSDRAAPLRIDQREVAPRQLDVVWDGAQLWLQDALRLGRTFVNGKTLNEWTPIAGPALVCFAGVRLGVVSHTAPSERRTPDFMALERAQLVDAHQHADVRLCDTRRFTLPPGFRKARLSGRDAR